MKMTVVVSAAVCGAMLATNAGAETEVVDGVKWTYSMSAKGAVVGTGSWYVSAIDGSTRGMVIVPESLGGRPVVAVGCGAFYRCSELTAVTIPASVEQLGTQAFYHCDKLKVLMFLGNEPSVGYTCFTYSPNIVAYRRRDKKWPAALPGEWNGAASKVIESSISALDVIGRNGYTLGASYVAGLNPNAESSRLTAKVSVVDGVPVVIWEPQLNEEDAAMRVYTVYGKKTLGPDESWVPVTDKNRAECRFFRVGVEMR